MPLCQLSIQSEQTSQIYAALGNAIVATIVNATILVVVQWPVIDHAVTLIWLASIALISFARLVLAHRYEKASPPPEKSRIWTRLFLIGTFLAALAWGSASVWLFPDGNLAHQVFLAFVVGGMAAGAVTSLSHIKVAIYSYLGISLTPLIIRFFFHHEELGFTSAAMLSLYLVMMLAAASRTHSNIKQNIILHNEVTQREYSLRQSEHRYQILLDTATDAFFLHDMKGKYIDVNQQACENLGYARDELLNMAATDIEVGPYLQELAQLWPRLEKGEKLRIEGAHRRKEGSTFPVEVNIRLVQLNNEQLVSAFAHDLTERIKAEQELSHTYYLLEKSSEAARIGTWEVDLDSNHSSWSKVAQQIHEIEEDYQCDIQSAIGFYKQGYSSSTISRVFAEAVEKGKPYDEELQIVTAKGNERWVRTIGLPVMAEGKCERIYGLFQDIDTQKRTEQALIAARDAAQHANRAKSDFLSRMSHELRTPMNAILGFGQLLQYDDTLGAEQQDNVQEILKAGGHLLELINEVLDLAKVESGRIDLSLEPVEVDPVIEACLSLMATLADRHAIRLTHGGRRGAVVRADRTRFKQALLNLLSNAIKYNREGGSVQLAVQARDEAWLRIAVRDSGRGIRAERLTELFQPFNRLEAENSEIEGTGIGLTLTKRMVELMGGTVGVESELDKGSTFWIELPAEPLVGSGHGQAPEETTIDDPAPAHQSADGRRRVLYIEDNPANLKLVAQILGRRPHIHLLTAHTPGLGIELARAHRPDLILLDINLPGMDGYQVLETLKSDMHLEDTPIIAVTANAMPRDIKRGMAAGFRDYLTKPINVKRLADIVRNCLRDGEQRSR